VNLSPTAAWNFEMLQQIEEGGFYLTLLHQMVSCSVNTIRCHT
jgi:hypothetical protein